MIGDGSSTHVKTALYVSALCATIGLCGALTEFRRQDFLLAQGSLNTALDNAALEMPLRDLLVLAHSAWGVRPFDGKARSALVSLAILADLDGESVNDPRQYALPSALMAANRKDTKTILELLQVLIAVLHIENQKPPQSAIFRLAKQELSILRKNRLSTAPSPGFLEYAEARLAILEKQNERAESLLQQATSLAQHNRIYAIWLARVQVQNGRAEAARRLVERHLNEIHDGTSTQDTSPLYRFLLLRTRFHLELLLK